MFRRLANQVNDAVLNATSSLSFNNSNSSDARVSELAAMGFREAEARHALRVADGNMTRATKWLLSHGSPVGTAGNPIAIPETSATTTTTTASQEDAELQRAIQASLAIETKTKIKKHKKHPQSAASKHAGQAAASRLTKKAPPQSKDLAKTHPKVQVPKRLSQHNPELVILQCAKRVAPYSLSVHTLLRSLKSIKENPFNQKYHTVNTTTAMFQRSLKAPGVIDFLKAMNFHPNYNNTKSMTLSHFDAAAFYLGISALEQIQKNSSDYKKDKELRVFQKDIASALSESSDKELKERKKFLSMLPSEPTKGMGSQITIEYGLALAGSDPTSSQTTKITRGFDHDDTLGDVMHWLGGQATIILEKLKSGEWKLVDRNRQGPEADYHFHEIELEELRERTLQYVGCWPSGRLAIVPKLNLYKGLLTPEK